MAAGELATVSNLRLFPSAEQHFPRAVDFGNQGFLGGEGGALLGGKHNVVQPALRIVRYGLIPTGAKYQAHRRFLALYGPRLPRIIQVEIQLSGVGVSKAAEFQVNNCQTAQPAPRATR